MKTKQWFTVLVIIVTIFTGARMTFAAQDAAVKPLEGTIWRYKDAQPDNSEAIWQFAAGGELNEIVSQGNLVYFGHEWRQEGVKVTFGKNGGYAVYEGEFDGPSRIKGTARNIKDVKWTFTLTQITKQAESKRYEKIFKEVKEHGIY